jgi:starch synthase
LRKRLAPAEFSVKVLFATSEFAPLVKTGGLADVSGALPLALARLGVDVRVLLPAYPSVLRELGPDAVVPKPLATIPAHRELPRADLLAATGPHGLPLLLLQCPVLFDRPGNPYLGPDGRDWPDNDLRFGLFSRVAALLGTLSSPIDWRPDVVHGQDWQSALAPVYLAYGLGDGVPVRRAASVITIHNLAYQGIFPPGSALRIGVPPAGFSLDGAEYYGNLSFLKGGLACADAITTVSPTYAREICTDTLGFGLQGLLRARSSALTGILNGVDTEYWNPATDPLIVQRYGSASLDRKHINKRALQAALGLTLADETPVLGVVSRLVEQKGVDLIADILDQVVHLPAQVVIQGLGDRAIEERLLGLARQYPRQLGVRVAFDEPLAHMIEAGADLFLMPSRFEPCGMNQLYSQRYGTLPIVCRTGGLADSVTDCTAQTLADGTATGFSFAPASAQALLTTVRRAVDLYRDPAAWQSVQRNAMELDVSWDASALRYQQVYEKAVQARAR